MQPFQLIDWDTRDLNPSINVFLIIKWIFIDLQDLVSLFLFIEFLMVETLINGHLCQYICVITEFLIALQACKLSSGMVMVQRFANIVLS